MPWRSNSGPLSLRRNVGTPRALTRRDSTSMTRAERMRPSTSIASPSLVNSSVTVRHLSCWPLARSMKPKLDLTGGGWLSGRVWCPMLLGCDHLLLCHRHRIKECLHRRFAKAPTSLMRALFIVLADP